MVVCRPERKYGTPVTSPFEFDALIAAQRRAFFFLVRRNAVRRGGAITKDIEQKK